ncbi:MAG: NACHT domain-containing protein [Anaerolineae bacterium]|nr:NACHT domain-containing protein [Anaerolineae bacterium]
MLDLVENIWIKGFLENVLNEMRSLNLDMSFADPEKVLRKPGMKDYTLPDSHAIAQAYYDLNRRLVILGEPGSGKTVTLLQLTRQLIIDARKGAKKPIPIVLALSSWAVEQLPFEDWLCKEIREKYGLPRRAANDLVKGEQLTYLLDGLDEVADAHREACLQAIKEFAEKARPVDYTVSCRKAEFQNLTTRLNVAGEIVINPLTSTQIDEYLKGNSFEGLREFKSSNMIAQGFAQIPFMLNTMAVVTREKSKRDIVSDMNLYISDRNIISESTLYEDAGSLRDYFLESYINIRLYYNHHKEYSDVRKIRDYLRWVAQTLIAYGQMDLYLESIQPEWAQKMSLRRRINWSAVLVSALPIGLLGIGVGAIISGLKAAIFFGLLGVISQFPDDGEIEPVEAFTWSKDGILDGWRQGLGYGIFGFFVSSWILGAVNRLHLGLFTGVIAWFLNGIKVETRIPFHSKPNAGLVNSLRNALIICLQLALMSIIIAWAYNGLYFGVIPPLVAGLYSGVIVGTQTGGSAVLRHMILRFYLFRNGYIPLWRYDKFLDYMAELVILRKVGGGYRFVHDYLRQYLASAAFVPDPMQKTE